jgi:3-oxoacyl-(acyl-carrier-protein) synthase III
MLLRAKIAELEVYLPEMTVANEVLEKRIHTPQGSIQPGTLERLFGIRQRHFAAPDEQVSDLAVKAAQPIVNRVGQPNIDLLIFAAACSDLIEPATCNIVQHKLGLTCPAFDLKNACNSFVNAIMTTSALIQAGQYQSVLIVNGEKLSDAIQYDLPDEAALKRHLAAYSLGDAGAAALITASSDESGLYFQKMHTNGAHWELCTIPGGGSMHPHDGAKNYLEGQTLTLKKVLAAELDVFFEKCLAESGWKRSEIKHLFTHQVSADSFKVIAEVTGLPLESCEQVFEQFGNAAAASIPLAIRARLNRNELQKGDKIVLIGLAAGVSISVQFMVW